jgi:hypothetical protein
MAGLHRQQTARHFWFGRDLPLIFIQLQPESRQMLSCYLFLDHLAGGYPAFAGSDGPCAADRFTSDIGVLLPMALCGRSSL